MKISSVILNWKNASLTIKCVESLILAYEYCLEEFELHGYIIIVDNGSDNHTINMLKKWHSVTQHTFVRLIFNDKNLGFSGGMNKGISHALLNYSPDYIWLVNNDLICSPNSLSSLIKAANCDPHVAIMGSTVLEDNKHLIQCAGGCYYNKWLGIDKPFGKGVPIDKLSMLHNQSHKFDYIYGAAMFIKVDFLTRMNGLNEQYFLYFEELDLVQQLTIDEKIAWCIDSVVYHKGSGSLIDDKAIYNATYYAAISAFKFTKRYYPLCLPSVIITRLLGKSYHAIKSRKCYIAKAVIIAIWHYFIKK